MKLTRIIFEKFKREEMPQVKSDDLMEAIERIRDLGIEVNITEMKPSVMISSQEDIVPEKVKNIMEKIKNTPLSKIKPIVVSKDNYIIDGHHRDAAYEALGMSDKKVPAIQIMLPQLDAIELYHRISGEIEKES